MKTSATKANKNAAEKLWINFQTMNEKKGKETFKRVDTPTGFSITGPKVENGKFVLNQNGKWQRVTIFTYDKSAMGEIISWDENAVTI